MAQELWFVPLETAAASVQQRLRSLVPRYRADDSWPPGDTVSGKRGRPGSRIPRAARWEHVVDSVRLALSPASRLFPSTPGSLLPEEVTTVKFRKGERSSLEEDGPIV